MAEKASASDEVPGQQSTVLEGDTSMYLTIQV